MSVKITGTKQVEVYGVVLPVPEWATHLTIDESGQLRAYDHEPYITYGCAFWEEHDIAENALVIVVDFEGDWRDSLVKL